MDGKGEPNFIHRFHIGNNRQRGNERSEPDIDFFSIHNSFPALNKGTVSQFLNQYELKFVRQSCKLVH